MLIKIRTSIYTTRPLESPLACLKSTYLKEQDYKIINLVLEENPDSISKEENRESFTRRRKLLTVVGVIICIIWLTRAMVS